MKNDLKKYVFMSFTIKWTTDLQVENKVISNSSDNPLIIDDFE